MVRPARRGPRSRGSRSRCRPAPGRCRFRRVARDIRPRRWGRVHRAAVEVVNFHRSVLAIDRPVGESRLGRVMTPESMCWLRWTGASSVGLRRSLGAKRLAPTTNLRRWWAAGNRRRHTLAARGMRRHTAPCCPVIPTLLPRESGVPRHTRLDQVCARGDSVRRPTAVVSGQPTPRTGLDAGGTRDRAHGRDQLHQWPRPLRRLAFRG